MAEKQLARMEKALEEIKALAEDELGHFANVAENYIPDELQNMWKILQVIETLEFE